MTHPSAAKAQFSEWRENAKRASELWMLRISSAFRRIAEDQRFAGVAETRLSQTLRLQHAIGEQRK